MRVRAKGGVRAWVECHIGGLRRGVRVRGCIERVKYYIEGAEYHGKRG